MSSPNEAEVELLAGQPLDDFDERALRGLKSMYEALDPVPSGLVDRICFGITLDALHAEIAELQRTPDLAGVRSEGATEAQTVTFTSASLTIMITITVLSGDRARIDGWAAPGGGVTVELRSAHGVTVRTADADGRFVFDDVERGLVQFLARQPGPDATAPIITPSLEI